VVEQPTRSPDSKGLNLGNCSEILEEKKSKHNLMENSLMASELENYLNRNLY
jgi:hypothetical protein